MESHTVVKDGACPATPPGRMQGMRMNGGGQAHDFVCGRRVEVSVTKKEELFAAYEAVKDKAICVTLFVRMPGGEIEIISNTNVEEKMAYIDQTYDDDLVHSNSVKIHIEDYSFECMDDPLDFGSAILNLKEGHKVARKGWNGKGMFLCLATSIDFNTDADLSSVQNLCGDLVCQSVVMKTADNKFVVGWVPSQADMLAEDWTIVE